MELTLFKGIFVLGRVERGGLFRFLFSFLMATIVVWLSFAFISFLPPYS